MSFNFIYTVELRDKKTTVKELSFLDYKNLAKSLVDTDLKVVSDVFETLFIYVCSDKNYNVLDKFLILLKLREVVLGNTIEFNTANQKIKIPTKDIHQKLNVDYNLYEFYNNETVYKFDLPTKLLPSSNALDCVFDCLYSIDSNIIDKSEKNMLVETLPALPLSEIYTGLINHYEGLIAVVPHTDFSLTPFNDSLLSFLHFIFSYNLNSLYDLEYTLRRNLALNANDFKNLSFQECNLLLQQFKEELVEAQKEAQKVDNRPTINN